MWHSHNVSEYMRTEGESKFQKLDMRMRIKRQISFGASKYSLFSILEVYTIVCSMQLRLDGSN